MHFDSDHIRACFDLGTYLRGSDYASKGRVRSLTHQPPRIEAEVIGSGGRLYRQAIDVRSHGQGIRVDGDCDCPVGHNCKHVVAVLIRCMEQRASAPGPRAGEAALPAALSAWMTQVQQAVTAASERAVSERRSLLRPLYLLLPDASAGTVQVQLHKARLHADGGVVSATPITDTYSLLSYPPAFMRAPDMRMARLFVAMSGSGSTFGDRTLAREGAGADFLRMACDSAVLCWADSKADVKAGRIQRLAPGPALPGALCWRERAGQTGMLHLDWHLDDAMPVDFVVPTEPPMYVRGGVLGELVQAGAAPAGAAPAGAAPAMPLWQLHMLAARAPPVTVQAAAALSHQLSAHRLDLLLPLPLAPVVQRVTRTDIRPRPHLLLGARERTLAGNPTRDWDDHAVLSFEYDGSRVACGAAPEFTRHGAAGSEVIVRDAALEQHAHEALAALGFRADADGAAGVLQLTHPNEWLRFTRHDLPRLRQQGWLIELERTFRFDLAEVEDWYADVDNGADAAYAGASASDWFELELGIVVNGARMALLPVLLDLIHSAPQQFDAAALNARPDDELLIADLPGGARVGLPWGRIKPMLSTLGELYFTERAGATLRLPVLEAARLAELDAQLPLVWSGGDRLRAIGHKLRDFRGVQAVSAPRGLQASLRPYQQDGLAWMQFLRAYQLSGILADDMGLGKTLQALSHILLEKEAGRLTAPALVVAPTSLMGNWQAEAARFAPGLRVLLLHGAARAERFDQIGQHDLVLTTYALLARDEAALCAHRYHLLILDESQYIKNSRSKAALAAAQLPAAHRLCMTGTPLQNHLGELWAQFHFLMPGLLGDEKTFNAAFRKPIEKLGDAQRNAFLVRRIRPFLLRRTKDAVATELPAKTEMVREIELTGAQRDLYETMRVAMDKKVRDAIASKGVARSQIIILDALLKLRQVCCDPRLVKLPGFSARTAPSAKLDTLMEMLEGLLDEGRRILVFSQFTSMLALIEAQLQARGLAYALLTGDTKDRTGQVEAFQRGQVSVFLISLKAGGVGLNLTAADTVIHYDPWWNPAAENQATDRAWRIGQDKPVFVYKLIAKGTLEEKIQQLQRKKSDLADAVLAGGPGAASMLTQDDLQAILAPL